MAERLNNHLTLEVMWLLQRGDFTVQQMATKIGLRTPGSLYSALRRMEWFGLIRQREGIPGAGGRRGKPAAIWSWVGPDKELLQQALSALSARMSVVTNADAVAAEKAAIEVIAALRKRLGVKQ